MFLNKVLCVESCFEKQENLEISELYIPVWFQVIILNKILQNV